jgi:hypothetical protein
VAGEKRRFADSAITGGFFDNQTSAEQRRQYLLGLMQQAQAKVRGGRGRGGVWRRPARLAPGCRCAAPLLVHTSQERVLQPRATAPQRIADSPPLKLMCPIHRCAGPQRQQRRRRRLGCCRRGRRRPPGRRRAQPAAGGLA